MLPKKKEIVTFLLGLFLVLFSTSLGVSSQNRDLENKLFEQELELYRERLANFASQDWVVIALTNNAAGSVLKEIKKFVDYSTLCLKFSVENKIIGRFGNCLIHEEVAAGDGWSRVGNVLVLKDKYKKNIRIELFRGNKNNLFVVAGKVSGPLEIRHFQESWHLILLFCVLYFIIFSIVMIVVTLRRRDQVSTTKIHDYDNVKGDTFSISNRLTECASSPEEIKKIARNLKSLSILKEAMLSASETPEFELINIRNLLEDLIEGYFVAKDRRPLCLGSLNPSIYATTDKNLLLKILGNLLDNAFKEVVGKNETFILTTLESPDEVDIVISNSASLKNARSLFRRGFSLRKSSGLGLSIVEEAAKKIGAQFYLAHSESKVVFGISLKKNKEASCPALYA